jgi:hypothetical protein
LPADLQPSEETAVVLQSSGSFHYTYPMTDVGSLHGAVLLQRGTEDLIAVAGGTTGTGGQAGTQAPDATPPPGHRRGSHARSTIHTLPADSARRPGRLSGVTGGMQIILYARPWEACGAG